MRYFFFVSITFMLLFRCSPFGSAAEQVDTILVDYCFEDIKAIGCNQDEHDETDPDHFRGIDPFGVEHYFYIERDTVRIDCISHREAVQLVADRQKQIDRLAERAEIEGRGFTMLWMAMVKPGTWLETCEK